MKGFYIVSALILFTAGILRANEDATQAAMVSFLDEARGTKERVEALFVLLGEENGRKALRQKSLETPDSVRPVFVRLFRSSADLAVVVLNAITTSNDLGTYALLRDEALQHADTRVRGAGFMAAHFFNDQDGKVTNAILKELREGNAGRGLKLAAYVAVERGLPGTHDIFLGYLGSDSPALRNTAVEHLGKIQVFPARAKPMLEKALAKYEEEIAREKALEEFSPPPRVAGELSWPEQARDSLKAALSKVQKAP